MSLLTRTLGLLTMFGTVGSIYWFAAWVDRVVPKPPPPPPAPGRPVARPTVVDGAAFLAGTVATLAGLSWLAIALCVFLAPLAALAWLVLR